MTTSSPCLYNLIKNMHRDSHPLRCDRCVCVDVCVRVRLREDWAVSVDNGWGGVVERVGGKPLKGFPCSHSCRRARLCSQTGVKSERSGGGGGGRVREGRIGEDGRRVQWEERGRGARLQGEQWESWESRVWA